MGVFSVVLKLGKDWIREPFLTPLSEKAKRPTEDVPYKQWKPASLLKGLVKSNN